MHQIVLAPDSFKGSLSAEAVCAALAKGILHACPDAKLRLLPMADGGEGTLDCFLKYTAAEEITCTVKNAYGAPKTARYAYLEAEKTALIESAQSIGLAELDKNHLNTKLASSEGVGELIADAVLRRGARTIFLTLGGTATTDGGMGALSHLGLAFLNANGEVLSPSGQAMCQAAALRRTPLFSTFEHCKFYFATDVRSPFCGKDGATYVFAPQKGANAEDVELLDKGLSHLAALYLETFHREVQSRPSMGAAGGLSGGLYAAFGGEVTDGFSLLASTAKLEDAIASADLVITGEGKSDSQTALGKLPMRVLHCAKAHGVPCLLLSGSIAADFDAKALGFSDAFSLKTPQMSVNYAIEHAAELLTARVQTALKGRV